MALAGSSIVDFAENQEKINDPELMQLVNENNIISSQAYKYWSVQSDSDRHDVYISLYKLHKKYVSNLELQNLLGKLVPYLCKAPCSRLMVDCHGVNSSGEYLDAIFSALKGTVVRSLAVYWTDLGAVQAELLKTAFSKLKHTKIEELRLQNSDLANNIDPLLSVLVDNTTVRKLHLISNALGSVQTELLNTAFSKFKNTRIEELTLTGNELGNNVVPLLSVLVGTDVRDLCLNSNNLDSVQAELWGIAFSKLKYTKIEHLGLSDNKLANNIDPLLSALVDNTTVRELDLYYNDLDSVELKTLCKAFSLLQHTAVDSLNFGEWDFRSWDLNSMEELLTTLSKTKIRKVSCLGPEVSGNLVDWFNSNIAYPHDTVYHESGLQRACIRTMMQNNLDLNTARLNIQVEKKIKEYESDKLGLDIVSISDEEDTTDEDIENSDEEDTTDEDIGNSDEEDTTNEDMEILAKRRRLL
ncbi:hypothetical protein [Candidatus Cardinium hertigii]|uniref:Leucine-rich repeat domain-containing protein n=1 Tax=Candidatus Cardinium hertigii TaxID=247481 RepID=A0A3N2QDK3_9BACT|nr:hypothetical protein [Candidatus Cardinium hertigii]ROT47722.1 hypothetical protein EDM02_00935 [Candidatus Cardinium hertigii]